MLCPRVREIHEQNQAQEQEQDGAYERNIVAPRDEEAIWDQEGDHDQ